MRVMAPVFAAVGTVALLSAGCSGDYMPIADDDYIALRIEGSLPAVGVNGEQFTAVAIACFKKNDGTGDFCGQREASDEHDPDRILVADTPMTPTVRSEGVSRGIHDSVYALRLPDAAPGKEFTFIVNEFCESTVAMPEFLSLTMSVAEKTISVSGDEGLRISWEPSGLADAIKWIIDIGTPEHPCNADVHYLDGLVEDSGSVVVPSDSLPQEGLPEEEGCEATVYVARVRQGTLDPGIQHGDVQGWQTATTQVVLKP